MTIDVLGADVLADAGGPDRRGFLVGGVAVAAAGLLAARDDASINWNALRAALSTHELVRPGNRGYGQARQLYDPRFQLHPSGIAYCGTPGDVSKCLAFARKYKLPFRVRSGGHSYAGWSSLNNGLVIDVTRINHFGVKGNSVTIGAGLDLINTYSKLARRGLALPGGSCPTVGIAGLTLGGGIGVLARQYGLTCDVLESVQIVTANGAVLNCTPGNQHSDLYWACRGAGGGNFGVATSFTFRAHRLTKLVLFFLSWPWSQAGAVVNAWQSWAPHGPDALWSNLHLSCAPGGSPVIGVGGTFVGSVHGCAQLLNELYARAGSHPSSVFLRSESYLNAMLLEAGCSGLTVPQCNTRPFGQLSRVPSYAKSDFFSRKLSAAGIRTLVGGIEALRHVHGTNGGVGAVAFDALGGAVNRLHPGATAFVHRDALFDAQYSTSWNYPGNSTGVAHQHRWLRSYYASVHPHANGQAYQNYIDPDLSNWRAAYYGANYGRLATIKAKYDPNNVFRFPQSITAVGSARGAGTDG